jgi:3-oxoacyl-[acyl-carrier protein] reductase
MQTVVITGGSRGIGAAAVRAFCDRGDRVFFLNEKNHEAAAAVASETGATAICCDVAKKDAVEKAFETIGHVDILICNAGICHTGLMSMMEESQWDRLFDVNVKGIFHCVNAAMPALQIRISTSGI